MELKREEMQMRLLTDEMDEDAAHRRISDIESSAAIPLDADTLDRLKEAAFAKLGIGVPESGQDADDERVPTRPIGDVPAGRRSFSRRKRRIAAALAILVALFLAVSIASGSPEVRAQLRKAFQFLPGFAVVGDTEETGTQYVLREPIHLAFNGGELEIRGFRAGDRVAVAELSGTTPTMIDGFILRNEKGEMYPFESQRSWSARDWTGIFYYRGELALTGRMEILIEGLKGPVPLRLEEADRSDRVEDFGITDVRQGVSVTAVTQEMTDGRTKVSLLPQLPKEVHVESYGMYPWDRHPPRMTNESNDAVALSQDSLFPHPNEMYYRRTDSGPGGYTLTVPEMILSRPPAGTDQISVPVPKAGASMQVNRTFDLQGFPVTIRQVRRLSVHPGDANVKDLLEVDVDVHYDPGAAESLLMVFPAEGDMKFDESTGALQHLYLPVPEKEKTVSMKIERLQTVIRGPWVFRLE
ncbi:hypothetical protein [Cohnella nanjingensis]|uniref:DUF4179 domain-containing protein n=1 Tax=Cohnella nanjingensis TaxID=1387779 RepID=A0A7X0VHR3_9BACL|nr:hypothetical protein [Cohnella nanjingensis]MBB6674422.1 hypothetical protein [Cohnella nanjingensis]